MINGYNNEISSQVLSIIDEWETKLVKETLANDIDGGSPNHYWIVKNMMGMLMEEMPARWNHTKLAISQTTTKMVELDMVIMQRDVMAIWKKLAQGFDSLGDGGSGSVSMAPSSSMNVSPTMHAVYIVPSLISTTIS